MFVPGLGQGEGYKFEIKGADGAAAAAEGRPLRLRRRAAAGDRLGAARRYRQFAWRDDDWMDEPRPRSDPRHAPISIYECHLGSWARVPEEGNRYLTYRELADG